MRASAIPLKQQKHIHHWMSAAAPLEKFTPSWAEE